MASVNDNVNLLPDRERKEGEAALKRVEQQPKSGEVKLVMPQTVGVKKDEKKSWFARRREAKETAKAEAAKKAEEDAKLLASQPKPQPVKPLPSAPAPSPAPAPKKGTPKPETIASMPAAPTMMPAMAKPAPSKPVPPKPAPDKMALTQPIKPMKPSKGAKMHEPEGAGTVALGVNLVPQDVALEAQGSPWSLYAGILIVVAGVWVGVSGYAISRAKGAEAQAQELNARLNQINAAVKDYETDKKSYEALQKQFSLVKGLVDNHVYWTPFLQKLEETTIPDVYYLGVSSNSNGNVTLRAVAKSYSAAARQIRAFERASTFVQSVSVNQARQELQQGATLPVPVVAFDMQLKLVPGIFTVTAPEPADDVEASTEAITP